MWPQARLERILLADDLRIELIADVPGTSEPPVRIWCVQVAGELYAGAYQGGDIRWYDAVVRQGKGYILAGDARLEVCFERVGEGLEAAIDAAYASKYATCSYLRPSSVCRRERAATVKVLPYPGLLGETGVKERS